MPSLEAFFAIKNYRGTMKITRNLQKPDKCIGAAYATVSTALCSGYAACVRSLLNTLVSTAVHTIVYRGSLQLQVFRSGAR